MVGVMWRPMASLSLASSPRCHTGFLSIGSRLCSRASFRPRLTTTPLHFANPSPPSGRVEDFHLQTVVHARHTMKGPGGMPGPLRLVGKPAAERSTLRMVWQAGRMPLQSMTYVCIDARNSAFGTERPIFLCFDRRTGSGTEPTAETGRSLRFRLVLAGISRRRVRFSRQTRLVDEMIANRPQALEIAFGVILPTDSDCKYSGRECYYWAGVSGS